MKASPILPLFDDGRSSAVLSPDGVYRYQLVREWDRARPRVAFLMLNPSTADATQNDPTIRKCIAFARSWGCGSLEVVNLFAFRATDPRELGRCGARVDPVGAENDGYILAAARRASVVVA